MSRPHRIAIPHHCSHPPKLPKVLPVDWENQTVHSFTGLGDFPHRFVWGNSQILGRNWETKHGMIFLHFQHPCFFFSKNFMTISATSTPSRFPLWNLNLPALQAHNHLVIGQKQVELFDQNGLGLRFLGGEPVTDESFLCCDVMRT